MKKLKLRLLCICCLVLFSTGIASSQVVRGLLATHIKFGLRGGVDVSNNRINKDILNTNNRLGFHFGGVVEVNPPIFGWAVEGSLLFGTQKFDIIQDGYKLSDYTYMRVPVSIKKTFGITNLLRGFAILGPYAEFRLGGGDLETTGSVREQYRSKTFTMGFDAGAGITILRNYELGMYYRKALTNNTVANSDIGELLTKKPASWAVVLTYFF